MKKLKNNKGITLIALVITIIVLLILAGVSLRLVAGNEGILNRAEKAVSKSNTESLKEEIELAISELRIAYYEDKEGFDSADEYIQNKLNGKDIPSGTITLEGETLKLTGKETGATPQEIGKYSSENGLIMKDSLTGGHTNTDVIGKPEEWTVSDDGKLSYYTGIKPTNGSIIIPNIVNGIKVREIRAQADGYSSCIFKDESLTSSYYNTDISEIRITNGISIIGPNSLSRMGALKSVTIPVSITEICIRAFEGCDMLETVNYEGTKEQWDAIIIDSDGNESILEATINYKK